MMLCCVVCAWSGTWGLWWIHGHVTSVPRYIDSVCHFTTVLMGDTRLLNKFETTSQKLLHSTVVFCGFLKVLGSGGVFVREYTTTRTWTIGAVRTCYSLPSRSFRPGMTHFPRNFPLERLDLFFNISPEGLLKQKNAPAALQDFLLTYSFLRICKLAGLFTSCLCCVVVVVVVVVVVQVDSCAACTKEGRSSIQKQGLMWEVVFVQGLTRYKSPRIWGCHHVNSLEPPRIRWRGNNKWESAGCPSAKKTDSYGDWKDFVCWCGFLVLYCKINHFCCGCVWPP